MSKKSTNFPLPNQAQKTARARRNKKRKRWLTKITMPNLQMLTTSLNFLKNAKRKGEWKNWMSIFLRL